MNLFKNSAAKMPCTFSFVDVDKKGVTGKGLRGDTNFMFLLDWLGVFGFSRTTSKEVSVPWINSGRVFALARAGLHRQRVNEFKATLDCTCRPFPQRTPGHMTTNMTIDHKELQDVLINSKNR